MVQSCIYIRYNIQYVYTVCPVYIRYNICSARWPLAQDPQRPRRQTRPLRRQRQPVGGLRRHPDGREEGKLCQGDGELKNVQNTYRNVVKDGVFVSLYVRAVKLVMRGQNLDTISFAK